MSLARASFVGSVAALLCGTITASQSPQTHRFEPSAFYTTYSFAHPAALGIKPGARAPQTPRFEPSAFYTTYSFAHPAALRIKPGDRVITKTIDAAGVDWNNKTLSPGRNPQTGPLY